MIRQNLLFLLRRCFRPALSIALLAFCGWAEQAAAQEQEVEKLPDPVEEKLESINGISKLVMHASYYPSPALERKQGKNVIPVLLLHGRDGTRGDLAYLARFLQAQGHACLGPDLRGHGDSSELIVGAGRVKLDPDKMRKGDFNLMVKDLESVKSWFLQKNNEEELNMEMLVVLGSDMSSVTAMNFALRDWEVPELISYKNCKDVKALILLSPERMYEGTRMDVALKHPVVGHQLSVLIIEGKKNAAGMAESKKVVNLLERQHSETSGDKKREDKEIVFYAEDTSLQGTKLVAEGTRGPEIVAQFIQFRVRNLQDGFSWTKRVKPGEE
jgi:pimeloyl-ACP methyl ester carboxylesterase